jgi:hypothetical protein
MFEKNFCLRICVAAFVFFCSVIYPVAGNSLNAGQYYYLGPQAFISMDNSALPYSLGTFVYSIQGIANRNGPYLFVDFQNVDGVGAEYWRNPTAMSDWVKILQYDSDVSKICGRNYQAVNVTPQQILVVAKDLGVQNYFFWDVKSGKSTHNWDWQDLGKSPARTAAYSYAGAKSAIAIPYYTESGQRLLAVNLPKQSNPSQKYSSVEELETYLQSLGYTSMQSGYDTYMYATSQYVATGADEYSVREYMYNWTVSNWLNDAGFGLDKRYFCALGEYADDQCIEKKAFTFVLNFWPNDPTTERNGYTLRSPKDDHEMAEKILSSSSEAAAILGWDGSENWYTYVASKYGHVVVQTQAPDVSFFSKLPVASQYMISPQPRKDYQFDESKYYISIMGDDSAISAPASLFHGSFIYDPSFTEGRFITQTAVNWGIDPAFVERSPFLGAYFFQKYRQGTDYFQGGVGGDYFYALAVYRNKGDAALDRIITRMNSYYSASRMDSFINPWDSWSNSQDVVSGANNEIITGSYSSVGGDDPAAIYMAHYYDPLGIKNAYMYMADSPYTMGSGKDKVLVVPRMAHGDMFGFNPASAAEFTTRFNEFKSIHTKQTPLIWFTNVYGPATSSYVKNGGGTDTAVLDQIKTSTSSEVKFVQMDELYYAANLLYNNELKNPAFLTSSDWDIQQGASIAASDYAGSTGKSLIINNYGFGLQQPTVLNNAQGKIFELTFWAKKDASQTAFAMIQELPSWQAKEMIFVDSTSWKQYTHRFTLGSNNQHLVTLATDQSGTGKAYYDDVRLIEVSDTTTTTTTTTTTSSTTTSSTTTTTTTTTTRLTTTTTTTTVSSTTSTTYTTSSTTSSTTTTTRTTTSSSSSTSTSTTLLGCQYSESSNLTVGENLVDFQTPHNYPSGMDCYSSVYRCPGGFAAKVYVNYDLETWYDYFYVYDSQTGATSPYSGNSSGYVWLTSNASSVRFRFMSDESINRWGVDVDKIDCYSATTTTTSTSSSTTTSGGATTSTTTSSIPSSTTTVPGPCIMKGNEPPCDEVTLSEVVDAINQWAAGNLDLGQVIDLINSWADPAGHSPS